MEKESLRAVTFELEEAPGKTVYLAGSFNDWQLVKNLNDKTGCGIYRGRLMLAPGEYQYKFVVDGEWRLDPSNPNFAPNNYGSLNSLLTVKPAAEKRAKKQK
jgi:1,4-alpha-glucan branching enzyme